MIKLVATDIDGTLIRESSSVLPEEIFDLIRELRKRDIYFAAASGRQYMGLKRLFAPVADQMLFISENGSNVVWKDEELYASVINPNLIKEMQEYAKHFPNMHLTLSTTKAMHSTGSDDLSYRKMMVDGYQNDMVFDDDEDGTKLKVIKMSLYCESGIRPYAKEIEDYCTENGIEFRTDSTNLENDYTRNKIRNLLFPWLKENINPSADMNMAKTASILREEEEFLERLAERAYGEAVIERTPDRITLDAKKLAKQDTVIRKRVIRAALGEIRQDTRNIGRTHTEDAEMILMGQTGKMINLPGNICVRKSYDTLDIYSGREEKSEFCYDIPYGKKIYVPEMDRFVLLAEKRQSLPDNCINVYTKKIDYDKIKDRIQLRTRRKGDVLSIKGGNKKIKDIFIDDKIPAEKRDTFPLIADGNSIIAVGKRLGFEYYVTDKTVKTLYIYIWEDFKNDRES